MEWLKLIKYIWKSNNFEPVREGVPLTLFLSFARADLETVKKLFIITGYKARMES